MIYYSYLNKDSEEDNSDDGSEEHLSHGNVILVQQEAKGKGNGTSQATVGNDELVFRGQLDNAELVDEVSQNNHTWDGQHNDKPRLGLGLCASYWYRAIAFFLAF